MKFFSFTITGFLFSLSVFAQTSFHFYFGKAAPDPAEKWYWPQAPACLTKPDGN